MRWKNTKALNQFIGNIVDERFQSGVLANSPEKRGASRKKPVAVDYALEAYLDSAATQPAELEDEYRDIIITQYAIDCNIYIDTANYSQSQDAHLCWPRFLQQHRLCMSVSPATAGTR